MGGDSDVVRFQVAVDNVVVVEVRKRGEYLGVNSARSVQGRGSVAK